MNLMEYVLRRLLYLLPVLIIVSIIAFLLIRVLPGNPALMIMKTQAAPPEALAELERQMGLDKPVYVQYLIYINNLFHGNLGFSWHTGHPVLSDLVQRFPATAELTIVSLLIAFIIAIPLGTASAIKKDSAVDHVSRLSAFFGISIPGFWFGLALIYLFYFKLGWFPPPIGRISKALGPPTNITGMYILDSLLTQNWNALKSSLMCIALPATSLSLVSIALITRILRSSILEILEQDFVMACRTKGLPEKIVVFKHVLRNALIPTLTVTGLALGRLLGGTVLIETVFSWPGIGRYVTTALLWRDYAAIQGFILLSAGIYTFINLVIDILYGVIDPRIRYAD